MKKGVSPLIATVLLIAFTVSIGSVVMNWGTGYVKEEQEKATVTSDVRLTCATDVNLKIMEMNNMQDYCYTNNSENVTLSMRLTKGTKELKGVRVNIISNEKSETKDYNQEISNLNFQMNLGGFSNNLINSNNLIEYVELVPYIDNKGSNYFCSGSNLVISDLDLCNKEISVPYVEENPEEDPEDIYFISLWSIDEIDTVPNVSNSSNIIKLPLVMMEVTLFQLIGEMEVRILLHLILKMKSVIITLR